MKPLRWLVGASVVLIGVLFVAGFPLHTYLSQRQNLSAVSEEASSLARTNKALSHEVQVLQTDQAVEQIARQDYGMVKPGEQAYVILPAPPSSAPPATTPRAQANGSSGQHGAASGGSAQTRTARSGTAPSKASGAGGSARSHSASRGLLAKILDEFSF